MVLNGFVFLEESECPIFLLSRKIPSYQESRPHIMDISEARSCNNEREMKRKFKK